MNYTNRLKGGNRFKGLPIKSYRFPFDRKSKIGKEARRQLKMERVSGVIINTENPEQFKVVV